MRLIDADALMKDVRENSESYFADDFAEFWVNRQPTIQPEPHWIPVTERLPKDGQYILAYYPEFECGCLVQKYRTIGNYGFVAWMPLPEPFKGVTDGRD